MRNAATISTPIAISVHRKKRRKIFEAKQKIIGATVSIN